MTELELISKAQQQTHKQSGLGLGSIVLLLGIFAVVSVVGLQLAQRGKTQPRSGPAPDFAVTTLDGEEMRLSDLRGKVVVLNFWASWCAECRPEAPELQNIWTKYRDRGVVVLGIAYTDTETLSRKFIQEFALTYPNAMDLGTRISTAYHIQGVPETFVIDREGNIAEFFIAAVNEKRLATVLARLLDIETS